MRRESTRPGDRGRRGGRRSLGRACLTAAGLLAAILSLAACGSGSESTGVASLGQPTTTSGETTGGGTSRADALAYSKCMREHGLPDFPDPNRDGEIALDATPQNGLGPDSPQMKAAGRACRSLEPVGTASERRSGFGEALKFARCMRSQGVAMPDPQPPGRAPESQEAAPQSESSGSDPQGAGGALAMDPDSPQFEAALQACREFLPSGGGPSVQSSGGEGP